MADGATDVVVSVCRIVNEGDSAAISTEPLLYLAAVSQHRHTATGRGAYPSANDLQSPDGAMATSGSKMVRAVMDSARCGSNRVTFPMLSPVFR